MSSKKEYQYDPAIGEDVRWSESRRSWITRDGRRTGPPSGSTAAPSRSSNTAPVNVPNAGRSRSAQVESNSELERGMAQMNIGSPSGYGRPPTTQAGSSSRRTQRTAATAVSGPYSQVLRDPRTGVETSWEVGSSAYTDQAGNRRTTIFKRVRAPDSKRRSDSANFRTGMVIEVYLVQFNHTAVSFITPPPNDTDSPTRVKRFVICNDHYNGDTNCFEACAIKTYNGAGVSDPDAVKWHHTIIYTLEEAPEATDYEAPARGELPMQPQPIRVEAYDRGKALDPMARLDYGTTYVFDRAVPTMSLFGRVHPDYLATFYSQLNLVRSRTNGPANPIGSQHISSTVSTSGSTTTVTPASRSRNQPASGYPTRGHPASGPSSRPAPVRPQASSSSSNQAPAPAPPSSAISGPLTVDEMRRIVDGLRTFAHQRGWEVPDLLNTDQLRRLAADTNLRQIYIHRIRTRWAENRNADDDDDDDDDEDDDDNG